MAFMSMFLVMILFIIVVIGLVILLTGIILDIIWGIKKKKKKKVNLALKIFAIFLTVTGILTAGGPVAAVGIMSLGAKVVDHQEIAEFDKKELVYVDDFQDIYDNGFDFMGDHYVQAEEMSPQKAHDNFRKEKISAVVDSNDKHRIIYSVDNLMGITILDVEWSSGIFVKESDIENLMEYYDKEAPLYCVATIKATSSKQVVENVDSARVRQIRDRIINEGQSFSSGDAAFKHRDATLLFYSKDDMCCIDFTTINFGENIRLCYLGKYIDLDEDDSAFIWSMLE